MRNLIVLMGMIAIIIIGFIGCDQIRRQENKIISSTEREVTNITCHTLFGIPYLCVENKNTETDVVEYVDVPVEVIVDKVVERIVIQERMVEVPVEVIVENVVETIEYVEVPFDKVVYIVIEAVKEAVPASSINNASSNTVVESVVDSIDYNDYNTSPTSPATTDTFPDPVIIVNILAQPEILVPPSPIPLVSAAATADPVLVNKHEVTGPTEGVQVIDNATPGTALDDEHVEVEFNDETWNKNSEGNHSHSYTHKHWIESDFEDRTHTHDIVHSHAIDVEHGSIANTEHDKAHQPNIYK